MLACCRRPLQFPEKAIPKFILRAQRGQELPIHGDGLSVRSYLYVEDVADAYIPVLLKGQVGWGASQLAQPWIRPGAAVCSKVGWQRRARCSHGTSRVPPLPPYSSSSRPAVMHGPCRGFELTRGPLPSMRRWARPTTSARRLSAPCCRWRATSPRSSTCLSRPSSTSGTGPSTTGEPGPCSACLRLGLHDVHGPASPVLM